MTILRAVLTEFKEAKPFVKWAGGKRDLAAFIISFMPKNFNDYFEPFLGGGALFFALFNKGLLQNKKAYLSDKNKELMNAYFVLQNKQDELLKELKKLQIRHSKEQFYEIRKIDRAENFLQTNEVFRAARFIYLNKTCFNGLCRYNSKGFFNTPIGSYKNPKICDENLILNAHFALQKARILESDFAFAKRAKSGDFVYFDPPYFPLNATSSFTSYTDNFSQDEHLRLFELFKMLDYKGVKLLQSNSNSPFIKELYKDFEIIEIKAKRAINCKGDKRGEVTELLIKGNFE